MGKRENIKRKVVLKLPSWTKREKVKYERKNLFRRVSSYTLPKEEELLIQEYKPYLATAIDSAERDVKGLSGIRSVKVKGKKEAKKVQLNTVYNTYKRWVAAGKPGKFVDFLWDRYAPIGAENDPKGLNKNWGGNVYRALKRMLTPSQLERAKQLNLIKLRRGTGGKA